MKEEKEMSRIITKEKSIKLKAGIRKKISLHPFWIKD
jgi:hypothetical protein